jgi:hypothetical protein
MNKVIGYIEKHTWMYVVVIVVLTFASFWRYLDFTFWKDDWFLVWGILNNHPPDFRQFGYRPIAIIEFFWMTRVFGVNVLPWQILGLILRAGAALAFSFFAAALTSSSAVGFLGGVLIAGTSIGMDAVGWPSAHAVLTTAIFLLIGFGYFVRYLHGKKDTWLVLGVLYLGIAFVLDPFRIFPLFFIIPFLALPLTISGTRKHAFRQILTVGGVGVLASAIVGWFVFRNDILASQLFSHLARQPDFLAILNKSYVIGNYFNSLVNLMLGWLFRFTEDASTGVYNKVAARIGFLVFCIMLCMGYGYRKTKSKKIGIVLFSLLWMFLFYIPNWLFEPRLTMGVTHRYMVISSFGFILAVSYGLVTTRKRTLLVGGSLLFVVSNIWTANYWTNAATAYRARGFVNSLWQTIDRDISKSKEHLIFIFEGEDPVRTYALVLSGSAPFGLIRSISKVYDLPIITGDMLIIRRLLCSKAGERFALNHVYAWRISKEGTLTNISLPTRRELFIKAMDDGCAPMID